jgi:hypothetical protein
MFLCLSWYCQVHDNWYCQVFDKGQGWATRENGTLHWSAMNSNIELHGLL